MPAKSIKYEPDTDLRIYEAHKQAYINCGYAPVDTKTDTGRACQMSKKDPEAPKVHMSFIEGRAI
jgi:hypothetical protein